MNQYNSLFISKFTYPVSSVLSLLPNGPELDKNNKFIVKEGNEVGLIICSAFVQLTEIHPIILRENILTQVR